MVVDGGGRDTRFSGNSLETYPFNIVGTAEKGDGGSEDFLALPRSFSYSLQCSFVVMYYKTTILSIPSDLGSVWFWLQAIGNECALSLREHVSARGNLRVSPIRLLRFARNDRTTKGK